MTKNLLPGLPWSLQRNGRFVTASQPGARQYELIQIFPAYCPVTGAERDCLRYNVGKLCVAAPSLYSEIERLITRHEVDGECLPSEDYIRLKKVIDRVGLSEAAHVGEDII